MKDINLGAGLFSGVSAALANEKFKIKQIALDALVPNDEAHGFSIDNIDELAKSMDDVGIQQNLVVEDVGNGYYTILTGRRRYYAAKHLLNSGNDKFKTLPCIVLNLDDIDLPLDDEMKRTYAIATTNAEQRKPTAADTAEMIRKLNTVYAALEAAGAKPKGRKREYIANTLGVSAATVGRYEYIEKHSKPEARQQLEKGEKSLRQAVVEAQKTKSTATPEAVKSPAADGKKIKKRAIFSLPYEAFTEDEYTLSGADYDEAWQLIRTIRESYTRLAAIVNKGIK